MKIKDVKNWPCKKWVVEIHQYTLFGEVIKETKTFDDWGQVCVFLEELKNEIIYFETTITDDKKVIVKYQF